MKIPFVICDVFTNRRFGGNPLAVITDARGISDGDMQRIAAEFGFSETTFVLPPDDRRDGADASPVHATHRVRIFTPTTELPFAGHPNVGTAYVLASANINDEMPDSFRFREGAGLVNVRVRTDETGVFCELRAPESLSVGASLDPAVVAGAVGLDVDRIATARHSPAVASVGLPFVIAGVVDRQSLAEARPRPDAFAAIEPRHGHRALLLYSMDGNAEAGSDAGDGGEVDGVVDCRMFFEHAGIVEDPATGSANGALAGLLASLHERKDGELVWRSRQGDDMGRSSRLDLRVVKRAGRVEDIFVGGYSVTVAEGILHLDEKHPAPASSSAVDPV